MFDVPPVSPPPPSFPSPSTPLPPPSAFFPPFWPADKWTAGDGQEWNLDRVMGVEAAKDFRQESCGGTHALGGMTISLLVYLNETGSTIAEDGPNAGKLVDKDGNLVTGGSILVRQRGRKHQPGLNVGLGKDDTLFAKVTGKVKFEDHGQRGRFISIHPVE